ncbi:hypothetical protein MSAN_00495300 [Mycena sanguinolenta]|uniref:Extracellular membrane protein CFEM domain-containing protein n=1 Tax=Mycena sanguinolenta TaxID=230812 RepID=A0A8H6ZAS8_9AGAR|nr:hypothetical protein MSAN_00495300 [Mycena sanguinolenta]
MEGQHRSILRIHKTITVAPCVTTCLESVLAAFCPDCDFCTDVNLQFEWLSCIQNECQALELNSTRQFVASECGTASPSTTPRKTGAFVPINSNTAINEPRKHHAYIDESSRTTQIFTPLAPPSQTGSSRGGSTQVLHSPSGETSLATSDTSNPTQTPQTAVFRNSSQTAAIAASVVIAVLVFGVAIILFRIRRRRLRLRERTVPKPFLGYIVQKPPKKKGAAPASAESAHGQAESVAALEGLMKHLAPERVPLMYSAIVAPEPAAATPSDPPEAGQDDETVTLRLHRLEAQFRALVATGLGEGSLPSYSG